MTTDSQWTDGYMSEIPYTHGFYREMRPTSVGFILSLCGVSAPDPAAPFHYCELGYGQGLTLNLLAAAYPHAQFWGTDFNPSPVAKARALAGSADLANVHLLEDSFAEFAERETPPFDYIALHGVYSWVSPENRRKIVEIVRAKLKPGGCVYVSYNCLPGWASKAPLRKLLSSYFEATAGPIVPRMQAALTFARSLVDIQAAYFAVNGPVVEHLKSLENKAPNYLAHEYFTKDFHPQYFVEVVQDLQEAKLSYVGPASLVDHVPVLNFTEESLKILQAIPDPMLNQTVRDFLVNRQFRRDVFVKGAVPLSDKERTERLEGFRFALKIPRPDVRLKVTFSRGELVLQPGVYEPLLDALTQGPATFAELRRVPALSSLEPQRLLQALTILVGLDAADLALAPELVERARASTRRMNVAILRAGDDSAQIGHLVSPVLGSAVDVNPVQQMLLTADPTSENPALDVLAKMKARSMHLLKDGKRIEDDALEREELAKMAEAFRDKGRPLLESLGVIA